MNLTVTEDFIPFTIAPKHVPPRPKREEEIRASLMGTLAYQRGPSLVMSTSI
jgi:hypothetical protein